MKFKNENKNRNKRAKRAEEATGQIFLPFIFISIIFASASIFFNGKNMGGNKRNNRGIFSFSFLSVFAAVYLLFWIFRIAAVCLFFSALAFGRGRFLFL